jgi:hypothetical protein
MSEELQWRRTAGGNRAATTEAGEYEVRWTPYGKTGKSWSAFFADEYISLSFSARMKDAQQAAQDHANGKRRHVA